MARFERQLEEAQDNIGIVQADHVQVQFEQEPSYLDTINNLLVVPMVIAGVLFAMKRSGRFKSPLKIKIVRVPPPTEKLPGLFSQHPRMQMGKIKAQVYQKGEVKTKFADVAGLEEAKV